MKKVLKIVFYVIFIITIIILVVLYNIYDNGRIKVVEETINIKDLSSDFEGFKILQISDLHGKTFGENQEKLIDLINSIDYDIIAITGDMASQHTDDITPFIEMLDGITNKDYIFFVQGNVDKEVVNESTNEITEEGQLLIDKGCKLLDIPYEIKIGESSLWISRFINKDSFYNLTGISEDNENSVKIAITHYPRHEYHYDEGNDVPDYDLVLAGHYHGGQWRIPLYGAIFIPDIFTNMRFFPNQEEVRGLVTWGDTNQYVTAGLGANSKYKFLEFRIFNTPEINLLTLTGK